MLHRALSIPRYSPETLRLYATYVNRNGSRNASIPYATDVIIIHSNSYH